jgi:hypothetical protein
MSISFYGQSRLDDRDGLHVGLLFSSSSLVLKHLSLSPTKKSTALDNAYRYAYA